LQPFLEEKGHAVFIELLAAAVKLWNYITQRPDSNLGWAFEYPE
jgi:hypothetical protein